MAQPAYPAALPGTRRWPYRRSRLDRDLSREFVWATTTSRAVPDLERLIVSIGDLDKARVFYEELPGLGVKRTAPGFARLTTAEGVKSCCTGIRPATATRRPLGLMMGARRSGNPLAAPGRTGDRHAGPAAVGRVHGGGARQRRARSLPQRARLSPTPSRGRQPSTARGGLDWRGDAFSGQALVYGLERLGYCAVSKKGPRPAPSTKRPLGLR